MDHHPGPDAQPFSLVPGDVLALRGLYAKDMLLDRDLRQGVRSDDANIVVRHDGVPLAGALRDAEAYWLPAGAEEAVLASEAPPARSAR